MKRNLITLHDFSKDEIAQILEFAGSMKRNVNQHGTLSHLNGKSIGLIFQKPSNRTRVSFEVGIYKLGGNCIYLGPDEINLGKRESTADVAKTLSRYLHGIVARTFSHQDIVDLGKYATVPVINGLSDLHHPCQALADIYSVQEKFGKLAGLNLAYIGDGNNVCNSLLLACVKTGVDIRVATPKGYEPQEDILQSIRPLVQEHGGHFTITHSPQEAIKGAHIVYADVWTSMGQEDETKMRLKAFEGYQINSELVAAADSDYIFMHCLPAHRGEEVTAEIIDGEHSIIFDQAENRMHVQNAILMVLLRENYKS